MPSITTTFTFDFVRVITVDHTKIVGATTELPILFEGTFPWLKNVAYGGEVKWLSGRDIFFTPDLTGAPYFSWYAWDMEAYDPVTGYIAVWIRVPVSSASDTTFWVLTGDNNIPTTFWAGAYAWGPSLSYYMGIWHCAEYPSFGQPREVALNIMYLTYLTMVPPLTYTPSGFVYRGMQFDGLSAAGYYPAFHFNNSSNVTLECWLNSATLTSQTCTLIQWQPQGNPAASCSLTLVAGVLTLLGGDLVTAVTVAAPSNSTWHHVVATISGTTGSIYIDGVLAASGTVALIAAGANPLSIGASVVYPPSQFSPTSPYSGLMDEIRLSRIAWDADYIASVYNNVSNPSASYSVGSPSPGFTLPATYGYDSPEFVASFDDASATALWPTQHSGHAIFPGRGTHGYGWTGTLARSFPDRGGVQYLGLGMIGGGRIQWEVDVPFANGVAAFLEFLDDGRLLWDFRTPDGFKTGLFQDPITGEGVVLLPTQWYFVNIQTFGTLTYWQVDPTHWYRESYVYMSVSINGRLAANSEMYHTQTGLIGGTAPALGVYGIQDLYLTNMPGVDDIYVDPGSLFGDGQALQNAVYPAPTGSWYIDPDAAPEDTSAFFEVGIQDPIAAPWDTSAFYEVGVQDPLCEPWDTSAFYEIALKLKNRAFVQYIKRKQAPGNG